MPGWFGLVRRRRPRPPPAAPRALPAPGGFREAAVDIGGKPYLLVSDDEYLDYVKDGFEPHMVRLFRKLVGKGDIVLDIGANIGCTAILFGMLARAVYAFEPSPSTFALLARNIAQSGLDNTHLFNFGLGSTAGEFPLTFGAWNRSGGYISNQTAASPGHTVETVRIARLDDMLPELALPPPDFLKLDVEGFEGHVLRGGARTIERHRPTVVLELNHWCLNAYQRTCLPDFFDLLRSMFPIVLAVDGDGHLDLGNPGEAFTVMYHHVLHGRFANIVAAFDERRLAAFRRRFRHGFVARD